MTAEAFLALRLRLGLTQAEMARVLGLAVNADGRSSDAVRNYEKGRRTISETVALLCRYVERYGVIS